MITPSTADKSSDESENKFRIKIPHSSAVCSRIVRRRQRPARRSPSKVPIVTFVLPTSSASSMNVDYRRRIGFIMEAPGGTTIMDRTHILERLRERIVRFAASRLMGASAEDLAQEVLLVLHEKYSDLDRAEDLLPVALEIARLKIWAVRRKTHRRGEDSQV